MRGRPRFDDILLRAAGSGAKGIGSNRDLACNGVMALGRASTAGCPEAPAVLELLGVAAKRQGRLGWQVPEQTHYVGMVIAPTHERPTAIEYKALP